MRELRHVSRLRGARTAVQRGSGAARTRGEGLTAASAENAENDWRRPLLARRFVTVSGEQSSVGLPRRRTGCWERRVPRPAKLVPSPVGRLMTADRSQYVG